MKTAIIMGNGPSLKDVNFDHLSEFHTFGLNNAYRMYYKLDWWPTYFGCFDYTVTKSNLKNFNKLTQESNSIKRFFFIDYVSESERITTVKLTNNQKWNCNEDDFCNFNDGGNSGVNATQVAICLGYEKIILLGVDCNYSSQITGVVRGHEVQVSEKQEDNDHWFEEYYIPGDRLNLPNADLYHTPNWIKLSHRAIDHGIKIINCSPISTLDCFEKQNLHEALQ